MHMSQGSDEYSDLPTIPKHNQMLVNQSYEFPSLPQATPSFKTNSQRHCPTLYPKDKSDEEGRSRQEHIYEVACYLFNLVLTSITSFPKNIYQNRRRHNFYYSKAKVVFRQTLC